MSLLPLLSFPAHSLAYRPFLDPLNVHDSWWFFLIPLSFGIAVVYKAARMKSLDHYWRAVFTMTAQIVIAMILLALASYLFVAVYVRFIAERL